MSVDTAFLKTVTLFEDLSDEELEIVASRFRERGYVKHEIVFFEEDTGNYMYIVQEGRVKVSRLLPNGKEMILAFHEMGEYFGEMSLIDGRTSPATVTTVIPSRILTVNRQNFLELLEHPVINRAVLKMLCGRCRDAWGQIEVLTFHNADARIRTALYQLCQQKGVATDGGVRINLKLTHKELADITGISRETATRVLSSMQSSGVLSVEKKQFFIADPDSLVDVLLLE